MQQKFKHVKKRTRRSAEWVANHRRCVQWRLVAMLSGMIVMEFVAGWLGLAEVYSWMRGLLAVGAFIAVWLPADWPCERSVSDVVAMLTSRKKKSRSGRRS